VRAGHQALVARVHFALGHIKDVEDLVGALHLARLDVALHAAQMRQTLSLSQQPEQARGLQLAALALGDIRLDGDVFRYLAHVIQDGVNAQ